MRRKDDEITDAIRRHWNARAPTFDGEIGHGMHSDVQRRAWLDLLADLAGAAPRRVLDAGCGTGNLALLFAELGHTVTAVDLAPAMLALARQKARHANLSIDFRLENAAALSDADATYDLILARHLIWTLPKPARGVAEWLRVLRPGGQLALIEGKWGYHEVNPAQSGMRGTALAKIREIALALITRCTLYKVKYRNVEDHLPFFGGPPAEELVRFLERLGVRDVAVSPLMSPVLWGEVPRFSRYLALGRR